MKCLKCDFEGNPNLVESGPHTKAVCPKCGKYIKMVSKDELDKIVSVSVDSFEEIAAGCPHKDPRFRFEACDLRFYRYQQAGWGGNECTQENCAFWRWFNQTTELDK